MRKHNRILEGALMGFMLGYAVTQWFHSEGRTLFGLPARMIYTLGGVTAVAVLLITWLSHRWEDREM